MVKQPMTPSKPVTEGQIGKLNEKMAARLLKRKAEIPSDIFQEILGDDTLIDEFQVAVDKRVERLKNRIVRIVTVNRGRSAKETLKATGRHLCLDDDAVDSMPNRIRETMEVVFFMRDDHVSNDELEKEYEMEGLVPVDPFSLAAINEADPGFADGYPNGTYWKDEYERSCRASFYRSGDVRFSDVKVDNADDGWDGGWWFAGVRKSTSGAVNENRRETLPASSWRRGH